MSTMPCYVPESEVELFREDADMDHYLNLVRKYPGNIVCSLCILLDEQPCAYSYRSERL